jgi:hypothetical protein
MGSASDIARLSAVCGGPNLIGQPACLLSNNEIHQINQVTCAALYNPLLGNHLLLFLHNWLCGASYTTTL